MPDEQVTPVQISDFPGVWNIITECVRHLQEAGSDQWGDFYPTREIIRADIEQSQMYKHHGDNDEVLGLITLNEQQEPEYTPLPWRYTQPPILVVHRLIVNPAYYRKGIGTRLMHFTQSYARQNGYRSIRLDAYTANPAAIALYTKLDFNSVGQICFPRRQHPFLCFEKPCE